jgi:hypothetical protein
MTDDKQQDTFKKLVQEIRSYVEKRIEIFTLEFQQKGVNVASSILSDIIGIILVMAGVLFLLTGAGIGLGYIFDNMMIGFMLLAFILIVPGYLMFRFKKNALRNFIRKKLIAAIDQKEES